MNSGLVAMHSAPRCAARTRRATPCQAPAVKGRRRCRMHGGATGSGAPCGERHGLYKDGFWTKEAQAARRTARFVIDHRTSNSSNEEQA